MILGREKNNKKTMNKDDLQKLNHNLAIKQAKEDNLEEAISTISKIEDAEKHDNVLWEIASIMVDKSNFDGAFQATRAIKDEETKKNAIGEIMRRSGNQNKTKSSQQKQVNILRAIPGEQPNSPDLIKTGIAKAPKKRMTMDKDFDIKFKALPPHVQSWMAEESTDLNDKIATKQGLDLSQTGRMVDVISKTILGIITLEGSLNSLKEALPGIDETILKAIALDIVVVRYWPIRDHLTGVEKMISELGGQLPRDTALYKDSYVGEIEIKKEPEIVSENVTNIGFGSVLEQYPGISGQFITSKPIVINKESEPVNATLSNWLEDYRTKKGNPPHSGMEREDYLLNIENTSSLDNSERTILRGLLKSYDSGGELPIDPATGKVVLSELFQKGSLIVPGSGVPQGIISKEPQKENLPKPNNIVDLRK